jgi:hypothetical protein
MLRTYLEHVEELEGLHLEAEGAVHHQQHQIRRLGCRAVREGEGKKRKQEKRQSETHTQRRSVVIEKHEQPVEDPSSQTFT